jgi:hypothetical protein
VKAPSVLQDVYPKLPSHLQEYVTLREGIGQLVAFVGLLAGVKPVMDDWIDARLVNRFVAFAQSVGLHASVVAYLQFVEDDSDLEYIVGGTSLNTTRARGRPAWDAPAGAAHIVLSRDRELVKDAVASGWYPLIAGDRVFQKPWIDHHDFGRLLGYPECCRIFFAQHNDWNRDNTLYQSYRRTRDPSYLCNSLLKHGGLSYTVHMPCSFDCTASMSTAQAVRAAVFDACRDLGRLADRQLRRPYLVLSEWDAFLVEGSVEPGCAVAYTAVRAVPSNRQNGSLECTLQGGDRFEIAGDIVRIYEDGAVFAVYQCVSNRFGPEVPFVVDFSGPSDGNVRMP